MENNNSGWYEPYQSSENNTQTVVNEQEAASVYTDKDNKKIKKHRRLKVWIIIIVSVLAVSLVALGAAVIAKDFKSKMASIKVDFTDEHSVYSDDENDKPFSFFPESDDEDGNDEVTSDDGLPSTKDDFFSSYFTNSETYESAEVYTDTYSGELSFSLQLQDPDCEKLTLQELYEKCSPSVVTIFTYDKNDLAYALGTGIIMSRDGLIITNTHVIEGSYRIEVSLYDDSQYDAKLVGADATSDIAVLKIEAKNLTAAQFGKSENLAIGEEVAAIGNPLSESFRLTLTNGIISGIDRGVQYNGRTMTVLQTNTALNSGNSGGPLFNMYGQVVGITNMKMMSSYSNTIEGIGFAIPTNSAQSIINSLIANGEVRGRTSIGITVGAVPESAASYYNIPYGLYVTDVTEGSDAETKGILPGDIITHVNGNEVRTTDDVLEAKEGLLVGDSITVTVFRESSGETFDVDIVLMDTIDVYG